MTRIAPASALDHGGERGGGSYGMGAAIDPLEGVHSASITTNKGQALRIDFDLEPLVSLRHQTTAAWRLEPRVAVEYDYDGSGAAPILTELDLARIDQTTLDFAAELLADGRAQPAIILPVSFFTMAARKGRHALAMIAAEAPETLKSNVIVEFTDVGRGTPVGRLTEVGGLVTSICRAVFVRVQPAVDMLAAVRGYRPHGITLDVAGLGGGDALMAAQMLTFGEQARGAAPLLVVQGLPNEGFFQVAQVAGMSHAARRAAAPAAAERSAA
jgi:hypothetical protein